MAKGRRRGRFIVFEGIDGAGTTTQTALTADWLRKRGELVHQTREPSDGPIGVLIRQALSGRVVARPGGGDAAPLDPAAVALLFAADRLDHAHGELNDALDQGRHVVCDRYVLSSLAYQSLDTDLKFVRAINARAPEPDLTVFLTVKPEVAMARIADTRTGRDAFETLPFQRRVADRYAELIQAHRGAPIVELDGEVLEHTVQNRIRAAIEPLL